MASPANGPLDPFPNGDAARRSDSGGRHGIPIQLNITGNGSAAIYYFDRPGTYNVWLGQGGAPRMAEYHEHQPRQNSTTQPGDRSSSSQPARQTRIPILKR